MAKTGPKPRPPEERFWKHVAKAGEDDCWLWTGSKLPKGYGKFGAVPGKTPMLAHRFSWEMAHGETTTKHVLHTCDNPSCVNPKHLFLGTNDDNIADRIAKGRSAKGDKHWSRRCPEKVIRGEDKHNAKLTEADVVEVLKLLAAGETQRSIAARFGVCRQAIGQIVRGKTWKQITPS